MELEYNHRGDDLVFYNYLHNSGEDLVFVLSAGYTRPRTTYKIDRRNDKFEKTMYVMEYVVEGKGEILCDGKQYAVSKGDFYMVNTMYPHCYYGDPKEPFGKLWLNLYGSFIEKITEAMDFDPVTVCRVDVLENFVTIHNLLKGKNAYEVAQYTEQLSVEIFHLLYKVYTQVKKRKEHNDRFLMIRNYIRAHITDDISVNRICTDNFISKSTLYRLFKTEVNMSPNEYIKKMKIDIASEILKKTNIDLHEIARQLGFYDYSHFSKVFTSVKKISPVAFRKKNKVN